MLTNFLKSCLFIILLSLVFNVNSQTPVFTNNGNLFIGGDPGSNITTLYIQGDYLIQGDSVSIEQVGKTTLTGDFINNITEGNAFINNTGLIEFKGTELQTIKGTANKAVNYLNFPDLRVNNPASVHLSSTMGMEVMNLDLLKGRLVLESVENPLNINTAYTAHLLIKDGGSVNYNLAPSNIQEKGVVEVQLALGNNYLNKKIIGFTPPFKRIYSDYFMFNFLSRPSPAGLFGDSGRLIESPLMAMNAGEGYLVGQGIVEDEGYYEENISEEWPGADYSDRATDLFSFSRYFMPSSISQFVTASDRFTGEELNITDVAIQLTQQGYNYVGNPFTTSLDLTTFVQETTVVDEWGVTRGSAGAGDLRNSFYVVSGGQGTYQPNNEKKFKFNVSYLLGQLVGGTLDYDGNPSLEVAPMQLFVVGKNTNGASNFIIPASARSHGLSYFLKSEDPAKTTDEIMLEIVDENTKAYDRLCIVFRNNASLASNDPYDATKIFNDTRGVSQIFTQSSDNKKMTTNVISPQTRSLDLYLSPSDIVHETTISAHRLYSLESINDLILEDKLTNMKTDLLRDPSYHFVSSPTDQADRFILHFSRSGTNMEDIDYESPVTVYSNSGIIYIKGLTERDKGSIITINDTQGRLIYKNKIQDIADIRIDKFFEDGIYITKITGQRSNTTKTIIKKYK